MSASASTSARPLAHSQSRARRPLSAIFLGNPALLPDLPEPPLTSQPASSSPASSGLPSPPASTSTGSGGTGRDRDGSSDDVLPTLMHDEHLARTKAFAGSSRSVSRTSLRSTPSEFGEMNGDLDGEDTARISSLSSGERRLSNESSALQRVKSLTQRNRLVLDKLASISSGSRLSTPSPTALLAKRRSPAPSNTNSAGSSSRSRRRTESISKASGSETERENAASDGDGDGEEDGASQTPTSTTGDLVRHTRTMSMRERRSSASLSGPSTSTSNTSLARLQERDRSVDESARRPFRPASRAEDIEAAALAAVAHARRQSPTDMIQRPTMPQRSDSMNNLVPTTPRRERTYSGLSTPSSTRVNRHESPMIPHTKSQRFSTIRDLTRKHQTRWLSQDISPQKRDNVIDDETGVLPRRPRIPDSPGRFAGESLRAAGLVRARERDTVPGGGDDDVFGENDASRRLRLSSELGSRPLPLSSRLADSSRPNTRLSERNLALNERNTASDTERLTGQDVSLRTPAMRLALQHRGAQSSRMANERPATSMAAYREEPRTAPPMLRSYNSSIAINNDHDRIGQPLESSRAPSRAGNMSTIGRRTTVSPLNIAATAAVEDDPEHSQLMVDALQVFESQLSRIPSLGALTTQTMPELYHSSDGIVRSAEALCHLLRRGTARCVENQIDAELNDNLTRQELTELWRECSGFFRDGTRLNDEVMRLMTSFLLTTAKVLREVLVNGVGENGVHGRTTSLDESVLTAGRRGPANSAAPTPAPGSTASGSRQSEGSKQSSDGQSSLDGSRRWAASSGEMGRTNTSITSLHSAPLLPPSSSRPSAISRLFPKFNKDANSSSDSELNSRALARLSLVGPRRLDTIKDISNGSIDTKDIASPGPLPLSARDDPDAEAHYAADTEAMGPPLAESSFVRPAGHRNSISRRTNSINVPSPLPTLLSESLLSRRADKDKADVSTLSSKATSGRRPKTVGVVRAATLFPSSSRGEPTTAVNTAQASPERPAQRQATMSISRAFTSSRIGGSAASAGLQQLSERDGTARKRTASVSSVSGGLLDDEDSHTDRLVSSTSRHRDEDRDEDGGRGWSRPRASLDSSLSASAASNATFSARTARDRRGTVTGLFPRQ